MNTVKTITLAICLAASTTLLAASGAQAETTAPAATATTSDKTVSEADKRAKAADCTKQANEKHLHGTAREKFRAECKRK